MRRAVYARVSTQRQTQMQTIEQQLERLQAQFQTQGWQWREELVIRSDGYRTDPAHPRDPAGVRLEPAEAAPVAEMFAY